MRNLNLIHLSDIKVVYKNGKYELESFTISPDGVGTGKGESAALKAIAVALLRYTQSIKGNTYVQRVQNEL